MMRTVRSYETMEFVVLVIKQLKSSCECLSCHSVLHIVTWCTMPKIKYRESMRADLCYSACK